MNNEQMIEKAWEEEERYWRLIQEGDDEVLECYDENVIAWPSSYGAAVGVEGAREYLRNWMDTYDLLENTMWGRRATVSGDDTVALLYYWSAVTRQKETQPGDPPNAAATARVNHTWLKQGDHWTIIVASTAPAGS